MFGDRRARVRSYSTVEDAANSTRQLGQISKYGKFNVVEFILGPLMLRIKPNLKLEIYEYGKCSVPAFVNFHKCGNRVTLNVARSVWHRAENGFAQDKYILCHEIGHIIMHSHDELAYSESIPSNVEDIPENERTEPQANLFADLFLLPERFLEGFDNPEEIADYFDIPLKCAQRRFEHIRDMRRRRSRRLQTGEVCPGCANFTLISDGTYLKCETCGSKVGL